MKNKKTKKEHEYVILKRNGKCNEMFSVMAPDKHLAAEKALEKLGFWLAGQKVTRVKRYFIVSPGNSDEDTIWQICSTTARDSIMDIYGRDDYEVVREISVSEAEDIALKEAIKIAKKHGAKRVTVI